MQISSSDLYEKITNNGNTYTKNYKKKVREADTDVQDMQESMETFKSSVRKLKRYKSGVSSRSRVEKQLKNFTSAYNDLKKVSANVSDKKVQKEMKKIDDYLTDNKKLLKKVGIKKGTNDKYSFDSEVLKDAEDEDLDALFTGNDSFIQKLSRMVRSADEKTDDAEYVINVRSFHSITRYSNEELSTADNAQKMLYYANVAQNNNELLKNGALTDDDKKKIVNGVKSYVEKHNELVSNITSEQSDLANNIKALDEKNKEELSKIGLTVKDGGELKQAENTDISEAFKESYNILFGSAAESYSSQIKKYAEEIYKTVLKTEELGLQVDLYL